MDTSKAARVSIDPGHLRAKVLAHIVSCGVRGATCDEVEVALRMTHQTASARVNELKGRHAIVDSGNRRPTRSGRGAAVWVKAEYEIGGYKNPDGTVEITHVAIKRPPPGPPPVLAKKVGPPKPAGSR